MRAALLLVLAASPALADPIVQVEQQPTPLTGTAPAPDIAIAAGNGPVVEIAGDQVSLIEGAQTITTTAFWAAAGITATPHAHRAAFDPRTQRFFVSAEDADHRYLAVSASADPSAGWAGFALDPATDTHLAVDINGVYLVGRAGAATDILAFPIGAITSGDATPQHLTAAERDLVPAIAADSDASAAQLLVGRSTTKTGTTAIDLWSIRWDGAVASIDGPVTIDLDATFRDPPPTALQPPPAPALPTGSNRVRSAATRGGTVYGIAPTQVQGRAAAFVFTVDVPTAHSQLVDIVALPGFDLVDPELSLDVGSELGIVAIATSATAAPALALTGKLVFEGVLAPVQIVGGNGPYSCAPVNSLSTYPSHAAIVADPGLDAVWADAITGGTGDCAFTSAPIEFGVFQPFDDNDGVFNGADDVFPIDRAPDDSCCSASGGSQSIVLSLLGLVLLRARRRARRSPSP